jgi:hypothetical protein
MKDDGSAAVRANSFSQRRTKVNDARQKEGREMFVLQMPFRNRQTKLEENKQGNC